MSEVMQRFAITGRTAPATFLLLTCGHWREWAGRMGTAPAVGEALDCARCPLHPVGPGTGALTVGGGLGVWIVHSRELGSYHAGLGPLTGDIKDSLPVGVGATRAEALRAARNTLIEVASTIELSLERGVPE